MTCSSTTKKQMPGMTGNGTRTRSQPGSKRHTSESASGGSSRAKQTCAPSAKSTLTGSPKAVIHKREILKSPGYEKRLLDAVHQHYLDPNISFREFAARYNVSRIQSDDNCKVYNHDMELILPKRCKLNLEWVPFPMQVPILMEILLNIISSLFTLSCHKEIC
jgi:hypothetical protein